jgi:hypothetical protein
MKIESLKLNEEVFHREFGKCRISGFEGDRVSLDFSGQGWHSNLTCKPKDIVFSIDERKREMLSKAA